MSFEPAVSLTEQIADHLGSEIIAGRLKPETRIQELRVAGDLGVSRGSVREALLILERRHLIEIIPRRGAVVSRLETSDIANFGELFTGLKITFFRKLAGLPKVNRRPFEQALEIMAEAVAGNDTERLLAGRAAFLRAGFEQLDNFYLCSVLSGLVPAGQRLAHLVALHPTYEARDTLRYHQALLDAVSAGDGERAAELVAAYNGREQKLALGCATHQPHRQSA